MTPPLWGAQDPNQAFLPSPLPGPLLTPRAIWLMVRTVRQGGSEPLGTWMGGGKGRGRGSSHVPSAKLSPLPLPNKGAAACRLGGQQPGTRGSRKEAVGMALGRRRGGACLPLRCPPPRVKAKVIPQPLREAGLGGEEGLNRQRTGAPGSWRLGGRTWDPGPPGGGWGGRHPSGLGLTLRVALLPGSTNPCGSQSHAEP